MTPTIDPRPRATTCMRLVAEKVPALSTQPPSENIPHVVIGEIQSRQTTITHLMLARVFQKHARSLASRLLFRLAETRKCKSGSAEFAHVQRGAHTERRSAAEAQGSTFNVRKHAPRGA